MPPEFLWRTLLYVLSPVRLLTGFFALKITLRFLEPKPGWPRMALLYLIHFITSSTVIYAGVGDYDAPLFVALLFVGGLILLCQGPLPARFSMGLILVMLPISLNAVLSSIRPPLDRFHFLYMTLFWGLLLVAVSKAMPENARPPLRSGRLWLLIDLLTLMPFGAAFSAIALTRPIPMETNPDPFLDSLMIQNESVLLIILGLSVVASLVILAGVAVLSRHEKLQEEQMLWRIRSQYYQNLEESQQQVRRLRHDMANHLTVLAGLEGEAQRQYLGQLSRSPAMEAGRRFCENQVANAVLSAKLPLMREGSIKSEWEVRLPEKSPLSDIDLCALLANSLDNAIEANLKLPEARREIKLYAAMDKGFFVLKLVNAANAPLPMEKGITTSKKDREQHGFGLASMREIVRRYHGTMQVESRGQNFCLLVMIPAGK